MGAAWSDPSGSVLGSSPNDAESACITTAAGRQIGYIDSIGAKTGSRVCFYLHGTPGSRLEALALLDAELLRAADIRLVAVDRSGFGLSASADGAPAQTGGRPNYQGTSSSASSYGNFKR